MALPRSLSPFRHRAYARFWFGAFVSNIGTWMETVGVGMPVIVTISPRSLAAGGAEVTDRASGERSVRPIDYDTLKNGERPEQNIVVLSGDTIYVP